MCMYKQNSVQRNIFFFLNYSESLSIYKFLCSTADSVRLLIFNLFIKEKTNEYYVLNSDF